MLLQALSDAALIIDAAGRIVQVNTIAETLFGAQPGQLGGQNLGQLLTDCEHARYTVQRAALFAAGACPPRPVSQWRARRRDGAEFPAEMSLNALPGPPGPYALAVVRDASERQRLERALRDSNRLKSEFFGHMSHELRSPLNGIIGFAEFLLEGASGPLNDEQREYLGDILGSGRKLLGLINGVMELSRLETGSAEMSRETFVLNAAIEEACSQVAAAAQDKGIGLHRSIAAGLSEVTLDRRRLLQVLHYLLSNAIKISGAGREIRIEAAPLGESALRMQIRDTGSAQRSAEFEQLLSDYPQLDSSAIRRFGGTGLDLVLAKKIIEAQGGFFDVENVPGQGAAFSLILPCEFAAPARLPATQAVNS
ncbi:MAG TPA: histidine kinase dimerization/phospho-acceptor domain-containing protein [Steroidobacteraceae bacterium]|jgi:protein-histidine pros-kinase